MDDMRNELKRGRKKEANMRRSRDQGGGRRGGGDYLCSKKAASFRSAAVAAAVSWCSREPRYCLQSTGQQSDDSGSEAVAQVPAVPHV